MRFPTCAVDQIGSPEQARISKVALLGCTNTGKSMLFNRLLKQRISPTTSFPYSTRQSILASLSEDERQLVVTDTPGVLPLKNVPSGTPQRGLALLPWNALHAADLAVLVVDGSIRMERRDGYSSLPGTLRSTLKKLRMARKPTVLVINKVR